MKRQKNTKEERNRAIISDYLRAWNTQEEIADKLKIPRGTIPDIVDKFVENGQMAEINKDFNPQLFHVWKNRQRF